MLLLGLAPASLSKCITSSSSLDTHRHTSPPTWSPFTSRRSPTTLLCHPSWRWLLLFTIVDSRSCYALVQGSSYDVSVLVGRLLDARFDSGSRCCLFHCCRGLRSWFLDSICALLTPFNIFNPLLVWLFSFQILTFSKSFVEILSSCTLKRGWHGWELSFFVHFGICASVLR